MRKWFIALYLLTSMKKGISSCKLARKIKVTEKTAWFMEYRLRHALEQQSFDQPAKGIVEADETYVCGKDKKQKGTQGRSSNTKTAVVGVKSRTHGVFARVSEDVKVVTVQGFIKENVAKGVILMTDEYRAYRGMENIYDHRVVTHKYGEYATEVDFDTHCNRMKNYWSHFKRSITGVYHFASKKHLNKSLAAQSFRYNQHDLFEWKRFTLTAGKTNGKRLTYNQLKQGA